MINKINDGCGHWMVGVAHVGGSLDMHGHWMVGGVNRWWVWSLDGGCGLWVQVSDLVLYVP